MKYIRTLSLITALVFSATAIFAQFQGRTYKYDARVKVYGYGGVEKTLAGCGGFDNPQFTMGDLNHDGLTDLVVFERNIGVRTFINKGSAGNPQYVYDPAYEANFPPVENFLILADYNCDNIPDLFQAGYTGVPGFDVWKGYYNASNQLCFTHYQQLYYDNDGSSSGWVNAYCNPGDVPAVVDVDNDGDLDFFAYNVFGNTIDYYKNVQVEEALPCDSIRIKLKDNCWGKLYQGYELAYRIPYSCDNSYLHLLPGERVTHTGNAICLLDMDGDGDKDYLGGNVSYPNVVYCNNGRVPYRSSGPDSMVAQDTTWQTSGHSLMMPMWPAIFNVDIDQDGKSDLLIAPNTKGENHKCIAFYKNTGTTAAPAFTYQSDSFLVDKSIDVGSAAYPVFFDYNKDGKPDLFIGSDGYYQTGGTLRSRVSYYLNTSTPGNPSFALQTENFLDIDSFGFRGVAMAVGDIDYDGKSDLIIGHTDGTLSYFTNTAASDAVQPVWKLAQLTLKDASGHTISVSSNATPFIYDIDKDGKPDLIIGDYPGYIHYYQNTSTTPGTISLQLVNNALGHVKIEQPYPGRFMSVPFIGKMDTTGKDYLLVGSYSGALYRFDGFQSGDTTATYNMIDSVYGDIDSAYLVVHNNSVYQFGVYDGFRSAPAVTDIDGDGLYEMVVGDIYGGVKFYEQDTTAQPPNAVASATNEGEYNVHIYPNPVSNTLNINWSDAFATNNVAIQLFDIQGQLVYSTNVTNSRDAKINVACPTGVYLCVLRSGMHTYRTKVCVMK